MPDLVWIALPGRPWTCARVIRDGGPGRAVTVSLFGVGVWVERRLYPAMRALALTEDGKPTGLHLVALADARVVLAVEALA